MDKKNIGGLPPQYQTEEAPMRINPTPNIQSPMMPVEPGAQMHRPPAVEVSMNLSENADEAEILNAATKIVAAMVNAPTADVSRLNIVLQQLYNLADRKNALKEKQQ